MHWTQSSICRKPWTEGTTQCLFWKDPESFALPPGAPLSVFSDGKSTLNLTVENGRPLWNLATTAGVDMVKESSAVDVTGFASFLCFCASVCGFSSSGFLVSFHSALRRRPQIADIVRPPTNGLQ